MNVHIDTKTSGYVSGSIISLRPGDEMKRVKGFKFIFTNILTKITVQEEITEELNARKDYHLVWDKFWEYQDKENV
jgi:hypothetical protein